MHSHALIHQARKEGVPSVVENLQTIIKAAFKAKQATLRVEIQVLNRLLAAENKEQRAQALALPGTADQLLMNNR
jgi:hypothetical protein